MEDLAPVPMTDSMPTTNTVLLMLGSLNGKMDLLLKHKDEQQNQIDRLEVRMNDLERTFSNSKAWVLGVIATVTTAVTLFSDVLLEHAGKILKVIFP